MNPKNFLTLFLIATLISCTTSNNKPFDLSHKLAQTDSIKNVDGRTLPILYNVDVKFETFIDYFNKDSVFQVSRIHFPLKVKELDDNFELTERIIQKAKYRKMDFIYDKSKANKLIDTYKQNIKVKDDKAIIQIRGIENGIVADYYFEKKNGKWILTTWTDSST